MEQLFHQFGSYVRLLDLLRDLVPDSYAIETSFFPLGVNKDVPVAILDLLQGVDEQPALLSIHGVFYLLFNGFLAMFFLLIELAGPQEVHVGPFRVGKSDPHSAVSILVLRVKLRTTLYGISSWLRTTVDEVKRLEELLP